MNYTIEFVDKIFHVEEDKMTKDLVNPQKMIQELQEYLSRSRPLFILSPEEKTSDLIVDGSLALEEQEKQLLDALSLFEEPPLPI